MSTIDSDGSVVMRLPRDTVRLRVTHDRVQLTTPLARRWWQFWKLKISWTSLAEAPCVVKEARVGDVLMSRTFD